MSLSELQIGAGATAVRSGMRSPARPAIVETALPVATPIVFDAAGSWCFGWYHRASSPALGVGVVLCRPVGYEAMCSYRAYTEFAEILAKAGFDVLRFDYHGTGDSAGSDADPARVEAWVDSIVCGAAQVRKLAGVSRLALFGVRLGATLAVQAAQRLGGVESLVMWAPCVTGQAFARELRAASGSRAVQPDGTQPGDLEALGCLYTAQTLQDLQTIDCRRPERAPAQRVLVIGRDDMPAEGPLPASYRALGADASYEVLPGYAKMMVEPHESVIDYASLGAVADWLAAAPAPPAARAVTALPARVRVAELPNGVREVPLAFGPAHSLFGILAEPPDARAAPAHRDTAVLLLNVGGNYRIGPNRFYVRMARSLAAAGLRAFRFDLGGIGDSRSATGPRDRHYYSRDSVADVSAAIDCLAAEGCTRFYLVGICSGSYVAFQASLADARVTGQVLMNSRLLEWRDGDDDGTWQALMQQHYKSTAFYWRALLRPQVYGRLWRGEVDVRGIAQRIVTVAQARLTRAAGRLLRRPAEREESVLAGTMRLGSRGTDTLVVMAAQDDGRDYVEFHFGVGGSRLRGNPNFRMVVVDDCDHTFSTADSQQQVIGIVQRHLQQRLSGGG
ncbi:MAG: hypothetical protein JWQ07_4629 [Ramlibacter sp.]|nr:hypothetical protein [Ramlibacter sp.]